LQYQVVGLWAMVEILSKRINGHVSPKGTSRTPFTSYKYECVSTKRKREKREKRKKEKPPLQFS